MSDRSSPAASIRSPRSSARAVTRATPGEAGKSGRIVVMAHDYRAGRAFESLLRRAGRANRASENWLGEFGQRSRLPSTGSGVGLAAVKGGKTQGELTPVDVHFSAMTAAVRLIMAAKLRAVLS